MIRDRGRRAGRVWAAVALPGLLVLLAPPVPTAQAYKRHKEVVNTSPRAGGFSDADINVIENLGQRIPAGLSFVDGRGARVAVDSLLHQNKPLLVTMGYYRCPQLCNLVHEGLAKGLKQADLRPGRDFLGLSVSVDPKEDPKSATTNQRRLLRAVSPGGDTGVGDGEGARHWPFLMPDPLVAAGVAPEAQAARLAEAVGFRYQYDDKSKQFAHAAVAFVLTPEGKISRYLYGVEFKPRDLRLALVEASGGRVGTTIDRVLLTCFKYDPMTQTYTPFVFGFVRIGALLSFAALATLLAVLWRREWIIKKAQRIARERLA
jgi:protein SCO1/2